MLKQFANVLLLVFFINIAAYADTAKISTQLPSPGLELVNKAKLIGPTQPNEKISLTVWLKFRNKAQMDQLTHDIYDRKNPRFRHYMSKQEYLSQFAPSDEAKQIVQKYFIDNAMHATSDYATVKVTGSANAIAKLLNVNFNNYKYENKIVYASTKSPTLPASIAQYVKSITGLTNIPRFHPMLTTSSLTLPTNTSIQGFNPTTLQNAYNIAGIPPVYGTKINGAGQTLILVDGMGSNTPAQIIADANVYTGNGSMLPLLTSQNFALVDENLNPCVTQCTASSPTGWEHEQALDIQSSHTLAPAANIVMVIALTSIDTAEQNVINSLIANNFTIAGFQNAFVISNSWSGQEAANEPLEPSLQAGVASGLSVNFSSGDCGDNTQSPFVNAHCHGVLSVDYPPSSTYVTAVGGASLFVDNNWNYAFETGWGDTTYNTGNFNGGSSGGISQFYGPASWQSNISNFTAGGYGVISTFNNKRAVPDIAMLADPFTGLNIIVGGAPLKDGGTSLACPLFSAVTVLVNQARALRAGGQNRVGQLAPMLYTYQNALANNDALHLIIPPHPVINGAGFPTASGAPLSSFTLPDKNKIDTFSWDSSLTIIENQFWNDVTGLGTPSVPNFVTVMSGLP